MGVGLDTTYKESGSGNEKRAADVKIYEEYNITAEQFDAVLMQAENQRGPMAANGSPAKEIFKQSSVHDVLEGSL